MGISIGGGGSNITDMGILSNSMIMSMASTAVAITATAAATYIAYKQYTIGRRQLALAEDKWGRFRSVYIPIEMQVSALLWSTPNYMAQYAMTATRYANFARTNSGQFSIAFNAVSLCTPRDISRIAALKLSELTVDASNLAFRTEESRLDGKQDLQWNRRAQFLNLGRDLSAMSAKFAAAGVGMLDKVGQGLTDVASDFGEMAGYLGYNSKSPAEQTTNRSAGEVYNTGTSSGLMGNDMWNLYSRFGVKTNYEQEVQPFTGQDAMKGE